MYIQTTLPFVYVVAAPASLPSAGQVVSGPSSVTSSRAGFELKYETPRFQRVAEFYAVTIAGDGDPVTCFARAVFNVELLTIPELAVSWRH